MHALLDHLHAAGLRAVPRVHGLDARGREILDHLPGEVVDVDTELLSEARLEDLGRWTRELHDAVRDFRHPGPWRFSAQDRHDLVAHNDLGAYNVAFSAIASPGSSTGTSRPPAPCSSSSPTSPGRRCPCSVPSLTTSPPVGSPSLPRRTAGPRATEILDTVPVRVRSVVDGLRAGMRAGDRSLDRLAAIGEPDRTAAQLVAFDERLPAVRALLVAP